jgi:hypothetical protein
MTDAPTLKNCPVPWCGSPDVKMRHFDASRRRHWVECCQCHFKTPQLPSKAKVVDLWSTRTPDTADELTRLRADVERLTHEINSHKDALAQASGEIAALQEQST